jgi:peptide/nickel transport system ATP-binding protein
MNQSETLISATDLRTWFELRRFGFIHVGNVHAVDGINFSLARGESVAFVGESGCGKSSLIRTLLGLHRPTAGHVKFEDYDLAELDEQGMRQHRARVGYIQQDPYGALPPFMDVRKLLSEPLIINGVTDSQEREARIRSALEEVRLLPVDDFLHKFPHMLSGGQQQRVVIARALILDPVLIVADEPVSMLDASVRVEVLNLLREIQARHNLAIIMITHDLSTVRYFATRIFVMYAGRIVEEAPVNELIASPRHPYSQALLNALPDPDPENASRQAEIPGGEPPSLLDPPPGCRFHPRCSQAIAGKCDQEDPPSFVTGDGHRALCWLLEE